MTEAGPVRVIVLGGGTAGWMTAAALARLLPGIASVTLVESAEIGIVGVGEATLPHLRGFLTTLGIDEADFMRATRATYKLGIEFQDFGRIGESYCHPFGDFGRPLNGVAFHQFWRRMASAGAAAPLDAYSYPVALARAARFAPPPTNDPQGLGYGYAYQFDATRLGPYLRDYATQRGVRRIEGRVATVERADNGDVAALVLADGRRVAGDLFVDCSGFRSLLLGETLGEPWQDWAHWLPCDRAVALPCGAPPGKIEPFTRAIAMPAGWRWRIPLQHRVGNGYVYSSAHLDDDAATQALLGAIEGRPLAEPRLLRFRPGRRTRSWVRNVIGVGLASGFLEPLESTSIHLAQVAITDLIELFPTRRDYDVERDAFNASVDCEYDRVRDFLILHYHATTRDDLPFWDHVRTMTVPDTLAEKIALFRATGHTPSYTKGLFLEPSWVAVFIGQGIVPERWDQRADLPPADQLGRAMAALRRTIDARVAAAPDHAAALALSGGAMAADG
jgi:tryptophan halogenase